MAKDMFKVIQKEEESRDILIFHTMSVKSSSSIPINIPVGYSLSCESLSPFVISGEFVGFKFTKKRVLEVEELLSPTLSRKHQDAFEPPTQVIAFQKYSKTLQ